MKLRMIVGFGAVEPNREADELDVYCERENRDV